jgi:hypothetical protein
MSKFRSWIKTVPTLVVIGTVLFLVLTVAGGLLMWGSNFADNYVHDQLSAQKISFPAKGSPALDPKTFPGLQQYAGQPVDNGPKAKAYANEFIAVHLDEAATAAGQPGATYSTISNQVVGARAAGKTPDPKLVALQDTMFRGEMLRGALLNAWGWDTMGMIAFWVGIGSFLGAAAVFLGLALGFVMHERSIHKGVETVITATREAVTV